MVGQSTCKVPKWQAMIWGSTPQDLTSRGQNDHKKGDQRSQNHTGDPVNLQRAGTSVTKATISNTIRRQRLKSCSARRVPLLKPVHVWARLNFARKHWDHLEEDWENVIWSDYFVSFDENDRPPIFLIGRTKYLFAPLYVFTVKVPCIILQSHITILI